MEQDLASEWVDYRKAFDLIYHAILARKLAFLDIPHISTAGLSTSLRTANRGLKLERDCRSEWKDVPAGVPQGTKLGPWLFIS